MLIKTRGIVLYGFKQGESGRIVKVFTEQEGLLSFFIRSTYSKKKGGLNAYLLPMRCLDMEIEFRPDRALHQIRNLSPEIPQFELYASPLRSSVAMFLAETFGLCLEEQERSDELFALLYSWIQRLEEKELRPDAALIFLLDLCAALGFRPHEETAGQFFDLREGTFEPTPPLHKDYLKEELTDLLRSYLEQERPESIPSRTLRYDLLEGLVLYLKIHIPQFRAPKSLPVLRETFL